MLLNEILLELANTSYPYELVSNETHMLSQEWTYKFTSKETENPVEYKVQLELRNDNHLLIFSFGAKTDTKTIQLYNQWKDDITNTGDAFKVFSTVLAILKDCLKRIDKEKLKIEIIEFAADTGEPSRVKLYSRFADNIGKYLPGWKLFKAKNGPRYLNFRFTKV